MTSRRATRPKQTPGASTKIAIGAKAEVASLEPENDESQALFQLEVARYQLQKNELDLKLLEEGLADRRADRALRKKYADAAFRFLVCFSIFCGLVLVSQGVPGSPFKLSDNVVIALIGSTAVAVVGLVGWVARGLFKAPEKG